MTSEIDSIASIISIETNRLLQQYKKENFTEGKIIKINDEDVLIKFLSVKNKNIPVAGVTLKVWRYYSGGYMKIQDSGVIRRIKDLQKVKNYYITTDEWIKNIDTSYHYEWSYREYLDLEDSIIKIGASGGIKLGLELELKLLEVYDSTAIARIQFQKYPWMKPDVGDIVQLK